MGSQTFYFISMMNREFLTQCLGPIAKDGIKDLATKREKNNANTMERKKKKMKA